MFRSSPQERGTAYAETLTEATPKIILHPEAVADLGDIWDYIAADNIDAADAFLAEIERAILLIGEFPKMGSANRNLGPDSMRVHPVREYLIVYAIDEQPTLVLAVLHGRRNPHLIGAILQERERRRS
ncbi:MAG: type II toxin-antitoxin system RelE/ParE family toxin [Bryobacteraceae bacterium]